MNTKKVKESVNMISLIKKYFEKIRRQREEEERNKKIIKALEDELLKMLDIKI